MATPDPQGPEALPCNLITSAMTLGPQDSQHATLQS